MIEFSIFNIKLPLAGLFLICAIAVLFFKDELGLFTVICFAGAFFCLFIAFVIIPHNAQNEYSILRDRFAHLPAHFRAEKERVDKRVRGQIRNWEYAALVLFGIGLIFFVIQLIPPLS